MLLTARIKNFFTKTYVDPSGKTIIRTDQTKLLVGAAIGFATLMLLALFTVSIISIFKGPANQNIPETNPADIIERQRKQEEEAKKAAEEAKKPESRLRQIYNEVLGATDLQGVLKFNKKTGVVTIGYTLLINDPALTITTAYEDFADLATRVFNIREVKRLNVNVYSVTLQTAFGQPSRTALILQITKSANAKINWDINKYRYETYAKTLTVHKIDSSLKKAYEKLLRDIENRT